jgi:ribosome-associated protein
MVNEIDQLPDPDSKSQRKRDMTALQELGEKLTLLPPTKLQSAALPEELLAALSEFARIPEKHGARRRQLQFIGKVMRGLDEATLKRIAVLTSERAQVEQRRQLLDSLKKKD